MDLMDMWRLIYQEELPPDIGPARELLCAYSNLKECEVEPHLYAIRKQAWKATRYPCIGRWRFLYLDPPTEPRYRAVLSRLTARRSTDVLLDLGCCVGQALRQLSADGVPPDRLIGLDLDPSLIEIGFKLFRDRRKSPASFIVADILNADDKDLEMLDGRVSIVHASNFWHLFSWTQQLAIAVRLTKVFMEGERRAMIYGRQVGIAKPETQNRAGDSFLHNEASFQELWDQVGALTGTRWMVEMEFVGERLAKIPGFGGESKAARYSVYRIL
ncbi:uncharacterized protein DNG_02051 [Cephalotrichum gorgonifer]|uniref:Methyltransferase domain-containing protein n=1 Tax=Cephalotrichum gorgonifer TaxID=2041049 RepID=A0AAE8SS64_9PEZI|nr:uncharacterized protein DNG_02051 [Cephalotrichum gorgonifer]